MSARGATTKGAIIRCAPILVSIALEWISGRSWQDGHIVFPAPATVVVFLLCLVAFSMLCFRAVAFVAVRSSSWSKSCRNRSDDVLVKSKLAFRIWQWPGFPEKPLKAASAGNPRPLRGVTAPEQLHHCHACTGQRTGQGLCSL